MIKYIKNVLQNKPADWLKLTTHRLDIYNEALAKGEFLDHFESLYKENIFSTDALKSLPTAYDYIRLGHPLSCILEWAIAKSIDLDAQSVITFSSQTMPILAVLRTNLLNNVKTRIIYDDRLPKSFDADRIRRVYGYDFELLEIKDEENIPHFEGSTVFVSANDSFTMKSVSPKIDFIVQRYDSLGSVIIINGKKNEKYISEIQHVRRRESIAMTPTNCLTALERLTEMPHSQNEERGSSANTTKVRETINNITGTHGKALIGSSGLSIQYAIMMGLIDHAMDNHPGKAIRFIVPPNCYGGTNDQARRVAACSENVSIVDLPVDGQNDMVKSVNTVLGQIAKEDAIPYIIAEIPTNPRVEVPNLNALKAALSKERKTLSGDAAIDPVFILDQTFCPNVQFLTDGGVLSEVRTISYASGSKFPSGGRCTAGYCVGNGLTKSLIEKIDLHLHLCDNEGTDLQVEILAEQLPSMLERIEKAYQNTREFVNYIKEVLPEAKINFVSEELASLGFTPSVFSLDLPTKGHTDEERESYKRALNHKLINLMITEIPKESKYCVSYGQLKGCYWTIPATSTQGTTKEGDKDYIARVAVSPDLDLKRHKAVFKKFVDGL